MNPIQFRRHLHMHPELSFREHDTAAFISARLSELGIEHRPIAGTGVLAKIEGRGKADPKRRAVVLRADIDALPIDERFAAPASNAPTPEESVINLQQRSQIEHYLEHLAPRYRQLILMRFFEEYSYEEIAAKLSLPLGTVKTQIHRAREQMCRLIAQGDER